LDPALPDGGNAARAFYGWSNEEAPEVKAFLLHE
jgi:hypothetical protein